MSNEQVSYCSYCVIVVSLKSEAKRGVVGITPDEMMWARLAAIRPACAETRVQSTLRFNTKAHNFMLSLLVSP
jgi:hypothetical protein